MSDGTYTTLTTQAWQTYTSVSGRTQDYIDLLSPGYNDFLAGVKVMDGLSSALTGDNPPPKDVKKAIDQITVLDGVLGNIGEVLEKFKAMDGKAVNQQATLDQDKARKAYNEKEGYDQDLMMALNNVLYALQLITADAAFAQADG